SNPSNLSGPVRRPSPGWSGLTPMTTRSRSSSESDASRGLPHAADDPAVTTASASAARPRRHRSALERLRLDPLVRNVFLLSRRPTRHGLPAVLPLSAAVLGAPPCGTPLCLSSLPLLGAPLSGAPLSGAPLSGTPATAATHRRP